LRGRDAKVAFSKWPYAVDEAIKYQKVFMPTHHVDRSDAPSVVDLVTDPEKFDRWQRQREREEAGDGLPTHTDRQHCQRPKRPSDHLSKRS